MTPRPSAAMRASARFKRRAIGEDILHDRLAVEADGDVPPVADFAEDDREVLRGIERACDRRRRAPGRTRWRRQTCRRARPASRSADARRSVRRSTPGCSLWPAAKAATAGPRMTLPSSLTSSASTPTGARPGETAEIDRRLGVAGAHEHAAVVGDQREDVAGTDEIGRRRCWDWRARGWCWCAPPPRCRW